MLVQARFDALDTSNGSRRDEPSGIWADCNTLLASVPKVVTDRLQRVQNAAARVVSNTLHTNVSARQHLRSATQGFLVVPRCRLSTLGPHGPSMWLARFFGTLPARFVVGLSTSRVRRNGTRFHTHSGTLLGVPTTSDRR